MPKLRRISGSEVIKLLQKKLGYKLIRQRGSHVRLRLETSEATHEVTVPMHRELDRGTLRSIIRSVQKYVPKDKMKDLFYTV